MIYLLFINGLKKVLTHLQKIKKYISDTGPVQDMNTIVTYNRRKQSYVVLAAFTTTLPVVRYIDMCETKNTCIHIIKAGTDIHL